MAKGKIITKKKFKKSVEKIIGGVDTIIKKAGVRKVK